MTRRNEGIVSELLNKMNNDLKNVYFVACGGSLVDLYNSYYFLKNNSKSISTGWYTANEFVYDFPIQLGKNTLVILCSHSGNTEETVNAAILSRKKGAYAIGLSYNKDSNLFKEVDNSILYEWGDKFKVSRNPMATVLEISVRILNKIEKYQHFKVFLDELDNIDKVVQNAIALVQARAKKFAVNYKDENFFQIIGSGATYGQAYGFAICSLMEMQWINATAIHSGEYFHGPFEVADNESMYVVLESLGRTRSLDERAKLFITSHSKKVEILDAKELGLDLINVTVVEYFNPILFYTVLSEYRSQLAIARQHPLEVRRYMGKMSY